MLNRRIPARSISIAVASALSIGLLASRPTVTRADDVDAKPDAKTDVENSRFQFEGEINANTVFVHSGPSENDYVTTRLDRGSKVTVVGIRFDWLKIIPPEGSFCYVAQLYVERRGDGSIGRVTNSLMVHVGSELNELKLRNAMRLEPGTDVQIIGKSDEFFKIKPPAGVYLYVNKQFVTPVHAVAVKTDDQGTTSVSPVTVKPPVDVASNTTTQPAIDGTASTQPAEALAPTTQPDATVAQAEFDKLESEFTADAGKPLELQDPAALSAGYDKLAKGGQLPDSLRKIAEYKAAALKAHADDRTQYVAVKKQQDEAKARMASLRAEREELEARVKQTEIKSYAAVGTLRPSSLQQGQQMLYRLTDPATGRTVLYIRSNDSKIGSMVNQFVGVKGTVTDDAALSLKLIEPTAIDQVDQTKLYTSVMATIIPPSLEAAGQASAGQQ